VSLMVNTHQPSERPVVNHADCFSECEIVGLEVILDCLQSCNPRTSMWSLPIIQWGYN